MLIEDIDSIEDLVIETGRSFNLKRITIEEARDKYFWLDSDLNIIFAYCNPISEEFYNLLILYEDASQKRVHDLIIPQYMYWIEFFSYSKYGTETEELIALRDQFIEDFKYKFGSRSILTAKEATRPLRPIVPYISDKDSLFKPTPILRESVKNSSTSGQDSSLSSPHPQALGYFFTSPWI